MFSIQIKILKSGTIKPRLYKTIRRALYSGLRPHFSTIISISSVEKLAFIATKPKLFVGYFIRGAPYRRPTLLLRTGQHKMGPGQCCQHSKTKLWILDPEIMTLTQKIMVQFRNNLK